MTAEPGVARRPGPHCCFARHHAVTAAPAGELVRSAEEKAMIFRGKKRYCTSVLAMLATCVLGVVANAGPEQKAPPMPVPPEIVKEWCDAGATVGWMKDSPPKMGVHRFWEPWREKGETGAIPAFRFQGNVGGVLEKLPDPKTAFGLDFHCGFYAGVTLKELAKFKNLHSLCIGGVQGKAYADLKDLSDLTSLRGLYLFYLPVTDAQLKHVTALKALQVLDLSHTAITDVGLKELAELKGLKSLHLLSTEVTATGIAALQKTLPECKIITSAPDKAK
jgi:internalin A